MNIRKLMRLKLTTHYGIVPPHNFDDHKHLASCSDCLSISTTDTEREGAFIGTKDGVEQNLLTVQCEIHKKPTSVWLRRGRYNDNVPRFKSRKNNLVEFIKLYGNQTENPATDNIENIILPDEENIVTTNTDEIQPPPPPAYQSMTTNEEEEITGQNTPQQQNFFILTEELVEQMIIPKTVNFISNHKDAFVEPLATGVVEMMEERGMSIVSGKDNKEEKAEIERLNDEFEQKEKELCKLRNEIVEMKKELEEKYKEIESHVRVKNDLTNDLTNLGKRKLFELLGLDDEEGKKRIRKKMKLDNFCGLYSKELTKGYENHKVSYLKENLFKEGDEELFGKVENPLSEFHDLLKDYAENPILKNVLDDLDDVDDLDDDDK